MKRFVLRLQPYCLLRRSPRHPAHRRQSPAGLWDATVVVNGLEIPFRFEITGSGSALAGSFFNGDEKVTSTSGKFENGALDAQLRSVRHRG